MSNNKKYIERNDVLEFANKVLEKVKAKYGLHLEYGSINLLFHNGACVKIMAEPKLKVCEMNEGVQSQHQHLKLARKAI